MITDPIADMITRIRNAQAVNKQEVLIPFSKLKFEIAKILKHEKYIDDFVKDEEVKFPQIKVALKYDKEAQPVINHIQRVSKPGTRIYVNKNKLPIVLNNLGIAVISTSQGLMSNKQAQRAGLGGEVLFEVW